MNTNDYDYVQLVNKQNREQDRAIKGSDNPKRKEESFNHPMENYYARNNTGDNQSKSL